jgi:hypothetical protein
VPHVGALTKTFKSVVSTMSYIAQISFFYFNYIIFPESLQVGKNPGQPLL